MNLGKRINHRFFKNNDTQCRGATAVEFGLLLPVLLLVLFAIVNFGLLFYDQAIITNAAREGARWASIHTSVAYGAGCTNAYAAKPTDPCQVAYSYAYNRLISFNGVKSPVVSFSAVDGYGTGAPQTVTVRFQYKGIGWFFGDKELQNYSATSVMLHE